MKKWILALIVILCASIILLVALNKNEKNKFIYTEENIVISNVDTDMSENTNIDSNINTNTDTDTNTNTNVSENTYVISNTIDDEKETDREEKTNKKDDKTTNNIKEEKAENVKEIKEIIRIGFPGAASYGYQTVRGLIINYLLQAFIDTVLELLPPYQTEPSKL